MATTIKTLIDDTKVRDSVLVDNTNAEFADGYSFGVFDKDNIDGRYKSGWDNTMTSSSKIETTIKNSVKRNKGL
jgi:hypothetical protein